jgi:hypothetical protein
MSKNKNYQMSMNEINEFIDVCNISGYIFDITLSGGEPLLWINLNEGLSKLKQSTICNSIKIFTNALKIDKLNDNTIENVNEIRISEYGDNLKNINTLKQKYHDKIRTVKRTEFWPNPKEPILNSTPAECMNPEFMLVDGNIYACPHSASIANGAKLSIALSSPLQINFLKKMNEIRLNQEHDVCSRCISNKKVRCQLSKIKNQRRFFI